ncbi:hypothetical protein RFI_01259, partial [Reticulomyxa filosa]
KKMIWSVPMKIRVGSKTISVLFKDEKQTLELPKNTEWVHLNADSTGFYASQCDHAMMEGLTKALKNGEKALTVLDKVCLVRDALAVAECGMPGETLNLLNLIVSFQNDEIGWQAPEDKKEDEDVEGLLRPLIIQSIGDYGYQPVIDEALKRFRSFMKFVYIFIYLFIYLFHYNNENDEKKTDISPSLKSVVFTIAIKNGDKKDFELLKKYYLTATDSAEKDWALRSLGWTTDTELIRHMLQWIKNSSEVRNQDKVYPFRTLATNPAGREIAWEFLQKTFSEWYSIFEGGFLVKHLAKLPSEFVSFEKASEIEKFYDSLDFPACKRSMQQCVENIKKNASWRKQDIALIEKWVSANVKK